MKRTRVWVLWAVLASAIGGALGEMPLRGQAPAQAGPAQAPAVPAGDFLKRRPVVPRAPDVEQQLLLLPDGYKAELVLSDPDITDPVGVTFDGNGRMYVLEVRTYMLDADGSDSRKPVSRISRHEDTDGDGVDDKHTVFADGLVLPRIGFPLEDGALLCSRPTIVTSTSSPTRTATAWPTSARRSSPTTAVSRTSNGSPAA